MKKVTSLLFTFVTFFALSADAVDAYFDFKIFHIPGQGPMLETHLNFFGESLTYQPVTEGEQASIEITMIFFEGDSIIDYSKKVLQSPVSSDSLYSDFIDQQRFMLDYGQYVLEIQLKQPSAPDRVETFTEAVLIDRPENDVFFSDIQWVSAFKKTTEPNELTKSGYDLLPFISNYIPREMNQLMYYVEIYGTAAFFGEDEPFWLTFFIEDYDNKRQVESITGGSKMKGGVVIPVMRQLDVSNLPTGNYNLVFEVRDSQNTVVARQNRFFQRAGEAVQPTVADYNNAVAANVFTKQITDIDTLFAYIQSLQPIAGDAEKALIHGFETNKELPLMQRFFYNFWYSRDNQSPEFAWSEYKRMVKVVEDKYATPNKHGYETEMGRVYLTYGPPDVVSDRPNEPSAFPYQIWQYFRAAEWTNVRFVFYDRTLLQSDYELLHCDKVRGEIKNPRWDMLIHQRDTPMNNVHETQSRDHFGGRTQDFWETPR